MTKFEFETLTHVEVADNLYYNVIEPFYMSVECDKQTFCKLWLQMNATKIRPFQQWNTDKWVLFELYSYSFNNKPLTAKMIKVANKWGMEVEYMNHTEITRRINELDKQYNTIH